MVEMVLGFGAMAAIRSFFSLVVLVWVNTACNVPTTTIINVPTTIIGYTVIPI
jgi:hypothetical protein